MAIAIPTSAIQSVRGLDGSYGPKTENGFEKRAVSLGGSGGERVEVLSGLNEGEEVAYANTFVLKAELNKSEADHEH